MDLTKRLLTVTGDKNNEQDLHKKQIIVNCLLDAMQSDLHIMQTGLDAFSQDTGKGVVVLPDRGFGFIID